ncbi:hypothetical protein, partial [Campylobacter sp. RM5063]|uniref:hypothetical protein n=1 Tax=Campylobacter sp. RM5063 TaxID=2735747 RepID=UPI00301E00CF|nr:hypothetical protein [Campylobacter sp. RM5063]
MENQTNKTITYNLRTFTPAITYPVFDSTLYGKHNNTIDYDIDYSILVKGLLPDSIIEPITDGVIRPKSNSVQVNNKGEATITYHKISDYNTKKIKPQFKYIKSGDTKETFTMNDINLYQYKLNLKASKESLDRNDFSIITAE